MFFTVSSVWMQIYEAVVLTGILISNVVVLFIVAIDRHKHK